MTKTDSIFWDSSALIPLFVPNAGTAALYRLLRRSGFPVVWWGTSVEILSTLARIVREGIVSRDQLAPKLKELADLRDVWVEISPSEHLRRLAEQIPEKYGLRAGDALQLAAALMWCERRPVGRRFACLDLRLAKAAEQAGFTIVSIP